MKIKKILIANRGEIAIRVIRSCRELGISTVAVFSDADRTALHVRYADEAYHIGPSPSAESYLAMDKIIEVAKRSGADAIHPGYGFLSENAGFSEKVTKSGILFIGPSAHSIHIMGDKISARQTMTDAGVPVVPGTRENIIDDNTGKEIANRIGLPVMIKAAAGGGGKGMRLIRRGKELTEGIRAAKSEALEAFGDESVYIEKYIESPHHIEFQILADKHGNIIHLCERECSVQRRHQKVVEETPSPLMNPDLREEMGKHAIAAARAVDYEGAGTIEFLVDDHLNYYFLEMNTRLQVEHPITELVTGIDLVKEQIKIAEGQKLSIDQSDIQQRGHAIECRIYAEDPDNNFMPSPGKVYKITEPMGTGVRCDGYIYEGYEIPIYYDPLISKLIIWGSNREEAISRMKRSLEEYYILGVKTSKNFLMRIMEASDFVSGKYDTHFIENNSDFLFAPCTEAGIPGNIEELAAVTALLEYNANLNKGNNIPGNNGLNRWKEFGRKKSVTRL
ncbi:MAG: acetyl-CoA carboxylase biotin carboxylase subunit [Bacteroidales bacterium]|nr:MAG: acetyl-CoA carboxylase biotin carboxylase subunit [Bacteroidales bacterium]